MEYYLVQEVRKLKQITQLTQGSIYSITDSHAYRDDTRENGLDICSIAARNGEINISQTKLSKWILKT